MAFKDLRHASGLAVLNDHLADRSFISGYEATQNDVAVFKAVDLSLATSYEHVHRWCLHMKSYSGDDLKAMPPSDVLVNVAASGSGHEVKQDPCVRFCFHLTSIYPPHCTLDFFAFLILVEKFDLV